jgi:hypothetical protein
MVLKAFKLLLYVKESFYMANRTLTNYRGVVRVSEVKPATAPHKKRVIFALNP